MMFSNPMAGTAPSSTSPRESIRIGHSVGMARGAVRHLACTGTESVTPQEILMMRYGLQMVGIDTIMNTAKVVEFQPCRNGADQHFIGNTVDLTSFPIPMKTSITTLGATPCPEPTIARRVHLRPESFAVLCGKLRVHTSLLYRFGVPRPRLFPQRGGFAMGIIAHLILPDEREKRR